MTVLIYLHYKETNETVLITFKKQQKKNKENWKVSKSTLPNKSENPEILKK